MQRVTRFTFYTLGALGWCFTASQTQSPAATSFCLVLAVFCGYCATRPDHE
jgi:hypothetical protein